MSTEQSNYQRIRANLLQLCDNSIAFGDSLTDDEDFHLDFRLLESGKLLRSARVSVAEDRLPIALFADFQV